MRWHDTGRTKDGKLRHPADGLAWSGFNDRYSQFALDPRSVRLGLASDGFNPFDIDGENLLWKKKSVFFDLEYWQHNLLRHNLDVIHIEKNVSDNIIRTLLGLDGKTKDNENTRKDLEEIGIRRNLHLINRPNGKPYLPPACYTMSPVEKS
nr:transposon, En/Spm-like protein [Tanacetum cinerariifolium]